MKDHIAKWQSTLDDPSSALFCFKKRMARKECCYNYFNIFPLNRVLHSFPSFGSRETMHNSTKKEQRWSQSSPGSKFLPPNENYCFQSIKENEFCLNHAFFESVKLLRIFIIFSCSSQSIEIYWMIGLRGERRSNELQKSKVVCSV